MGAGAGALWPQVGASRRPILSSPWVRFEGVWRLLGIAPEHNIFWGYLAQALCVRLRGFWVATQGHLGAFRGFLAPAWDSPGR